MGRFQRSSDLESLQQAAREVSQLHVNSRKGTERKDLVIWTRRKHWWTVLLARLFEMFAALLLAGFGFAAGFMTGYVIFQL